MAVARFYSSISQPTTLGGGISNANVTIQVGAVTGFPTSYPYTLALDYGSSAEELVDVTNASGTTLTVVRGVDGTSAQTHSVGAVVRHVSSARDFADAQTHMAATAAVHGVAGTLVGTSDTQTLANKTLTTPTISGAALSGTLSGTPTFSGLLTFSAGANVAGGSLLVERPNATDNAYRARVVGDANSRYVANADGKTSWGPGNAVMDTFLYRNAAGELRTSGQFTADGTMQAANFPAGAWSTWTPTWSTSTGLHLPSYGSAVVTGRYMKVGRTVFFTLRIGFASDTTFGTSAGSSDNWTWTLPVTAASAWVGTVIPGGFARVAQDANGAMCAVRIEDSGTTFQLATASGQQDGNAMAQPGQIDGVSPWIWNTTGSINAAGFYESAT